MSEDRPLRSGPAAPARRSFRVCGSRRVLPSATGMGYPTKSYKALIAHGFGAAVQVFTSPPGCCFMASGPAKAGRVAEEGTAVMSQGHL